MPEPDERAPRPTVTDWTRYAIFWGVFPLGFTGGEDVLEEAAEELVAGRVMVLSR